MYMFFFSKRQLLLNTSFSFSVKHYHAIFFLKVFRLCFTCIDIICILINVVRSREMRLGVELVIFINHFNYIFIYAHGLHFTVSALRLSQNVWPSFISFYLLLRDCYNIVHCTWGKKIC